MFTAGVLVWLNCGELRRYTRDYEIDGAVFTPIYGSIRLIGWPMSLHRILVINATQSGSSLPATTLTFELPEFYYANWKTIPCDVGTGLGILLFVSVAFEWMARRTQRRRIFNSRSLQ